MSLLPTPKPRYGDVEETRPVDDTHTMTTVDHFNDGTLVASKTVIRERNFIPFDKPDMAGQILSKHYSDAERISPDAHTEFLKSHKGGYFLITEYTLLR